MANSHPKKLMLIFAALIFFAIPISASLGGWKRPPRVYHDIEQLIGDVCSKTDRADACRSILKSDPNQFDGSDEGEVAASVINLGIVKSEQIANQLYDWYRNSTDDKMKEKYESCSMNFSGVYSNLGEALKILDYQRSAHQIEESEEELEQCRRVFEGSPDPGHVGDRIDELRIYLDMIRAATANLEYIDDDRS